MLFCERNCMCWKRKARSSRIELDPLGELVVGALRPGGGHRPRGAGRPGLDPGPAVDDPLSWLAPARARPTALSSVVTLLRPPAPSASGPRALAAGESLSSRGSSSRDPRRDRRAARRPGLPRAPGLTVRLLWTGGTPEVSARWRPRAARLLAGHLAGQGHRATIRGGVDLERGDVLGEHERGLDLGSGRGSCDVFLTDGACRHGCRGSAVMSTPPTIRTSG